MLALPATVAELTQAVRELVAAQQRTQSRLERLEEGQRRTESRLDRLEEGQRQLVASIRELVDAVQELRADLGRVSERLDGVSERLDDVSERLDLVSTRSDYAVGWVTEFRYRERPWAYGERAARRAAILARTGRDSIARVAGEEIPEQVRAAAAQHGVWQVRNGHIEPPSLEAA